VPCQCKHCDGARLPDSSGSRRKRITHNKRTSHK
jgi:hypothetical protein